MRAVYSEKELLLDLEFAVRQFINEDDSAWYWQVHLALERLRKFRQGERNFDDLAC